MNLILFLLLTSYNVINLRYLENVRNGMRKFSGLRDSSVVLQNSVCYNFMNLLFKLLQGFLYFHITYKVL